MKIKLKTEDLLPWLTQAAAVVPSQTSIDVLRFLRLEVRDEKLVITSSDGGMWMSVVVDTVECEGGEPVCVSPTNLLSSVKTFDKKAEITLKTDGHVLKIVYPGGTISLPTVDEDGYPMPKAFKIQHAVSVDMDQFAKDIKSVLFAVDKSNDFRPVMESVCIDVKGDKIITVGTDGHVLAKSCGGLQTESPADEGQCFQILLSYKLASVISKTITGGAKWAVNVGADKVSLLNGRYTITACLTEAQYPKYDTVIPTSHKILVKAGRTDVLTALSRIVPLSNDSTKLIILSIKDRKVSISTTDIDFNTSAEETIEASVEGSEDIKIGLKGHLLDGIVKSVEGDELDIEITDPSRAIVVYGISGKDKNLALLMPAMINE